MNTLSIRLPEEMEARLDREAQVSGRPRSEVAREALNRFLDQSERDRFMNELVDEARKLHGDTSARRETLEVAEELLPLENEALEIAEGGTASPDEERWWE